MMPSISLGRSALWMMLSRVVGQALAAVFTVGLARRLGSAGFGEYAFVAALVYVANSLTTFGTDMVLIRQIAGKNDFSGVPAGLLIQLGLSIAVIAAAWAFAASIPNQTAETLLALRVYLLSLLPLAFFTVFSSVLRGLQHLGAYAALSLAVPGFQAAALILPGLDLVSLCELLVAIQFVVAALAGLLCANARPGWQIMGHLRLRSVRSLLVACAPLALLTVLGMLYQRMGLYLLSTMTTAQDTGLFSAAARAVEASKGLHIAVLAVLYPAMSLSLGAQAADHTLLEKIHRSRNILLVGGAGAAVLFFSLAGPLTQVLYGAEYIGSVPIMRVLAWTLLPYSVNSYLTLSLVASHRERQVVRALALSLVAMLLLCLWQIPLRGPTGAAWAALTAECVQSLALLPAILRGSSIQGVVHELPDLPG